MLDGYSGDQRFYLAYGQSWREVWSEGLTRRVVLSNPHSPSAYRVNGVVRNDAGWYAAFPQIKAGDTYYPGARRARRPVVARRVAERFRPQRPRPDAP